MTYSVVFYTNAHTQNVCETYPEAMADIADGVRTHGAHHEKLKGKERIYSMRLNQKGRIIYTYFKHHGKLYPLILEADENHDYSSKYLDSNIYRDFLDKNEQAFIEEIEAGEQAKPSAELPSQKHEIQYKHIHIIGQDAISLSDEQMSITAPALVEGPPGSGKTCVAFRLLEKSADKKVIYITQSKELTESVNAVWAQSPQYDEFKDNVTIVTYEEMIQRKGYYALTDKSAEKTFNEWFGEYAKKSKYQNDSVYQECRIISGYSKDDYLNAGEKQTLYHERAARQWVYEAFEAWGQYCVEKQLNFVEFKAFNNDIIEADQYDYVLIDEAQDLSHLQLKMLINLAKNHQIIYCLDPRQSIADDNPKLIYLQKLFHELRLKQIKVVQLNAVYRSPKLVMKVAEKINELRISMTPSKKKEASIDVRRHDNGEVVWLDAKDPKSFAQIEQMAKNRNVCIIAPEKEKQKLIKYGFPQVFTIEDIKGLQYETVIIYNMMSEDIYRAINYNLRKDSSEIDAKYSSPLSKLFTAMTRAEQSVYFYQENPHPVSRLIEILKDVVSTNNKHEIKQETTPQEWLAQADKLYARHPEQALAILRAHMKMTQEQVAEWVNKKNTSACLKQNQVILNRQVIPPPKVAVLSTQVSNKKKKGKRLEGLPARFKSYSEMLVNILQNKDINQLATLLNIRGEVSVNWDLEINGVSALSLACKSNDIRKYVLTDKLISDKKVDINVIPDNSPSLFYSLLNEETFYLADIFYRSERLDLDKHLIGAGASVEEFSSLLFSLFLTYDNTELEPMAKFFERHNPSYLVRMSEKLFDLEVNQYRDQYLGLAQRAINAGYTQAHEHYADILKSDLARLLADPCVKSQTKAVSILAKIRHHYELAANHGHENAQIQLSRLIKGMQDLYEPVFLDTSSASDPEAKLREATEAFVSALFSEIVLISLYLSIHFRSDFSDCIDWNYQDKKTGMTPLMLLCRSPQFGEIGVRLAIALIEMKCVDITLKDNQGYNAFIYMVLFNPSYELLQVFEDHKDFQEINDDMVARGNKFLDKILLRIGTITGNNPENAQSSTSAMISHARTAQEKTVEQNASASQLSSTDLFLSKLKNGARNIESLDFQDESNHSTMLMCICGTEGPSRNEAVRLLIQEKKVNIYLRDKNGRSAFIYACAANPNPELIELFLMNEAFNISDELEPIVSNNEKETIMRTLLDNGPIEAVVKKHKPAFHSAAHAFLLPRALKRV